MSVKKFFYFGVLPALGFQMIGAALYFLWDSGFSQWIYTATKILLVLWPLLWLPSIRKHFTAWQSKGGLWVGILLGILELSLIGLVLSFMDLSTLTAVVTEKAAAFGLLTPAFYILFAIFFSLLHSLLEEYYWRWFVFRGLMLKMNWIPAALLGSAAFAGHHYFVLSEFFSLPLTLLFGTAVGVAGFIWCALYKKYQTLWPSYISHIFVDAVLMVIGYTILL
ncbi:MAG: type II CAAX endopeptidase family protein [Patescibacteria group bacterium]